MRSRVVFASSSAVPPKPRRPPPPPPPSRTPDDARSVSSAPVPQEKKGEKEKVKLRDARRRDALLGAAFSALATAGLAGDRATAAPAAATQPPTPSLSPPPPPAGWSYASKGKDWSSLGFDSCGATGQQSPINISPPFTRIREGGGAASRRGQQQQEQQQQEQQPPFLELEADYRSAAFDAEIERGITASPKFTVVGSNEKRGGGGGGGGERDQRQQQLRQQRHPAGGVYLLRGGSGGGEKVFYPLVQFHFHRPGEEALEGRRGVLGAHLVHQREGGDDRGGGGGPDQGPAAPAAGGGPPPRPLPRFVVVAVAFDLSRKAPDAALDALFGDGEGGDEEAAGEGAEGAPWRRVHAFDPSRLLPEGSLAAPPSLSSSARQAPPPPGGRRLTNFFAFEGSLTTPPCTKGARFYFARGRKGATSEQVARAVLPRGAAQNARPLQERGGRVVWEG